MMIKESVVIPEFCGDYNEEHYSFLQLQKEIHQVAREHGWWDRPRDIGMNIALMHSELSEALEELRMGRSDPHMYFHESNPSKPEGFYVELADCIIRILDLCGSENVDMYSILSRKIEYNKTRSYRHGGKVA